MKKLKFLLLAFVAMISLGASAKTDVTSTYLTNGDLSSLTGWTILDNFYTDWETDGDVAAIEFYSAWSSNPGTPWGQTKDFDFSQSPTLPAGYYRLCVNAFYREGNGNGTNTKAYIYAGDKQQYVVGLSSAGVGAYTGSNDLHKAANAFSLGEFSNEFDFQVTEENANQPLKIGFHGVFNTWCSWCCLGPVTIYEYTVDDYMDSYDEIVAKAELLYDSKMNKTVLANLKEYGVVDDERFAARAVERCAAQNISARQTLQKLYQKGVPAAVAKSAVADGTFDEEAQVRAWIEKKYAQKLDTPENTQKVFAALCRKGFSFGAVRAALKQYCAELEYCEE